MRVLLLTHYFSEHRGGIEIVAAELARRLIRRSRNRPTKFGPIDVVWLSSDEPAAASFVPTPDDARRVPVPAWNITERRFGFPYPLWNPLNLYRIGDHVRNCDIVHIHDALYQSNAMACLWSRVHRKPVVVTQHVGPIPYNSAFLRGLHGLANRTLARMVLASADQTVFISPRVQRYFSRFVHYRRPPQYFPNGVDTDKFCPMGEEERQALRLRLGWPADRRVRLFVGRFVEKKGLPLLRRLASLRPHDLWVFVGWGPVQPDSWGLSNVRSVGALPQQAIADYYRAADLLMLPSVGEGFPLVVQEAMACGLPALISPETLEGSSDAHEVLSSAALDENSWNKAVDRLDKEDGPTQRRRMAEFARRWDYDRVADRYMALFESILGR
jgi:glycosyltransferase involved in cell wall biosynthesis